MHAPETPRLRLLLAYDGSGAAAAAIRAAARLFPGAHALVVYHRSEPDAQAHASLARLAMPDAVIVGTVREYEHTAAGQAWELAHRGEAMARHEGFDASAEVRSSGSAWRAILNAADDEKADVIVCGSRGHGPVARAWLGSTSSSLVHHATRTVLVVPPGAEDCDGPTVIGYDGSEGARAAVAAAAHLLPGRPALLVHAWSSVMQHSYTGSALMAVPVPDVSDTAAGIDAILADGAEDTAEDGAKRARTAGLTAEARAVESGPGAWRTLAAVGDEESAAVIVTGARGRGALASTLLGSVSSGLVHNAERPVLVVGQPRP